MANAKFGDQDEPASKSGRVKDPERGVLIDSGTLGQEKRAQTDEQTRGNRSSEHTPLAQSKNHHSQRDPREQAVTDGAYAQCTAFQNDERADVAVGKTNHQTRE